MRYPIVLLSIASLAVAMPAFPQERAVADERQPGDAPSRQQVEQEIDTSSRSDESRSLTEWVQKKRAQVERLIGEHGGRGFFPEVGIIVAGSGLAAGGGYRNWRVGGSPVGFETAAMFSFRGYELYRLQAGLLEQRRSTLTLRPADSKPSSLFNHSAPKKRGFAAYADLRYRDYPRHPYYGVGIDSREEDRSDYLLFGGSYDAVVQAQLNPIVGISGRIGVLDLGTAAGQDDARPNLETVFDAERAPGLLGQPSLLTVGIGVVADGRDLPPRPRAGAFLGAAFWRFSGGNGDRVAFNRVVIDGRYYARPFTPRGVIAARALLGSDHPASGTRVPFYLSQTLGGTDSLRGFSSFRFRDTAVLLLSAEYRWEAHRFVEIAPFLDLGTVAPELSRLSAGDLHATPGIGLRLIYGGRVLVRMDWSRSSEGQRVSFATGPLF